MEEKEIEEEVNGAPEEEGAAVTDEVVAAEAGVAPTDEDAGSFLNGLIEAAERRGYLRARNELARAAMGSPRLWENPQRRDDAKKAEVTKRSESGFLSRVRPSVWD